MASSQGSAYNELLQNFHMISFFKNFPTNFKSKIINGSYESINTYAILLALRSEPVIHQRSFIESCSSSKYIKDQESTLPNIRDSLPEKDLEGAGWWQTTLDM